MLGSNSTVFEKMLFSVFQMVESKTSIIRLDDVLKAEMELLLKFCNFHENYRSLVRNLSKEATLSIIAIAHRFEFSNALTVLNNRLLKVIPEPTSAELKFVDRLNLHDVLLEWSKLCESPLFYRQFIHGQLDFSLSKETIFLFSSAQFASQMRPRCMQFILYNFYNGDFYFLF